MSSTRKDLRRCRHSSKSAGACAAGDAGPARLNFAGCRLIPPFARRLPRVDFLLRVMFEVVPLNSTRLAHSTRNVRGQPPNTRARDGSTLQNLQRGAAGALALAWRADDGRGKGGEAERDFFRRGGAGLGTRVPVQCPVNNFEMCGRETKGRSGSDRLHQRHRCSGFHSRFPCVPGKNRVLAKPGMSYPLF